MRLFSTKNLKPLGTLEYHKGGCQAVVFANALASETKEGTAGDESDEEEEMSREDMARRSRWLASAGRDGRVAIWALISFEKTT